MHYIPVCGMYASYISIDIMCASYYGSSIDDYAKYCKPQCACNLLKES